MTSTVLKACHRSLCVETSPQDGDSAASSQSRFPHKAFWVILSASLLLVIVALGLTGHLGLSRPHSQVYMAVNIIPAGITSGLVFINARLPFASLRRLSGSRFQIRLECSSTSRPSWTSRMTW